MELLNFKVVFTVDYQGKTHKTSGILALWSRMISL